VAFGLWLVERGSGIDVSLMTFKLAVGCSCPDTLTLQQFFLLADDNSCDEYNE
jgi:hypothetical protein